MKTSLTTAIVGIASASLMVLVAPAMASNVDFGINIGIPGFYAPPPEPVYVRPAPVYVEQRPVYIQPRPVYIQPRPYYVQPTPVYIDRDQEYRWYWKENRYRHHHHDDEDDD
ncbi:hypothetical protein [Herbaspirillum sp. RV1423]|uniref:hypothetical protein n=1 Tax=Herbaspirillum sp. RV1423 TaxID=1443993 RepID=UPI0009DE03FC|nr:hypothetical protein [Herbaspirillum sp. RV1423]